MGEVHHHYHQLHHHHRRSSITTVTAIAFLMLASATAIGPIPTQQLGGERESRKDGIGSSSSRRSAAGSGAEDMEGVMVRRRLGGPGSSPPTCKSKCGRCTPCKPVHVPIRPGFSLPLEYYPEAWRCKCGNKLFMP